MKISIKNLLFSQLGLPGCRLQDKLPSLEQLSSVTQRYPAQAGIVGRHKAVRLLLAQCAQDTSAKVEQAINSPWGGGVPSSWGALSFSVSSLKPSPSPHSYRAATEHAGRWH